jgi:hypothetical protein
MWTPRARVQGAPRKAEAARAAAEAARSNVEVAEARVREASAAAARAAGGTGATASAAATPLPADMGGLTVAELQAELVTRGLDKGWDPAEGKAVLVERLKVRAAVRCVLCAAWCVMGPLRLSTCWLLCRMSARREVAHVAHGALHVAHVLQAHAKAVAESSKQAAEAAQEQEAAVHGLAAAKAAAAAAATDAKTAAAAAAAAAKVLDCPPAPLVLHAKPLSEGDALDCRTLDQVLAYTVDDSKVRSTVLLPRS